MWCCFVCSCCSVIACWLQMAALPVAEEGARSQWIVWFLGYVVARYCKILVRQQWTECWWFCACYIYLECYVTYMFVQDRYQPSYCLGWHPHDGSCFGFLQTLPNRLYKQDQWGWDKEGSEQVHQQRTVQPSHAAYPCNSFQKLLKMARNVHVERHSTQTLTDSIKRHCKGYNMNIISVSSY